MFAAIGFALIVIYLFFSPGNSSTPGRKLPPLSVQYIEGTPTTEGKPMLVEFWATWCPPCRASIPHLNELYRKYKSQGLVIIGISNEPKATVENFLTKIPMDYYPAIDPGNTYGKNFNIKGIPHAFLVDKTGTIVWEGHPMALQESAIDAVVK